MLKSIVNKILEETCLDSYILNYYEEETPHLIEGETDKYTFKIKIKVDPNIEEKIKRIVKKKNVKKDLENLLYSVILHEDAHWRICPFDITYLEEILSGVSKGLIEVGFEKEKINEEKVFRIANLVCDIIVNVVCASKDQSNKFVKGREIKYFTECCLFPDENFMAFVDSQFCMYDHKYLKNIEKLYGNKQKIRNVSKKIIEVLGGKKTAEIAIKRGLNEKELEMLANKIEDPENWYDIAKNLAKIFSNIGEGKNSIPLNGEDDGREKLPFEINGFLKNLKKDEELRKELINIAMEKGRDEEETAYMDDFEKYKESLEKRANEIVVEFSKSAEKECEKFIVTYLNDRKEEKVFEKIRWSKTKIVKKKGKDEFFFYKKILPLYVDGDFQKGVGNLMDVLFIIDKSLSMSEKILGKSKYELLEESIAGVVKYLKNKKKAYHQNFGVILFGEWEKNSFSGWKSYYELDSVFKLLYINRPKDSATYLNPEILNIAEKEAKDNFLIIMATDGELHNSEEAASSLIKVINKGNYFSLFQIGESFGFSNMLKRYGQIFTVEKSDDLAGCILKTIKSVYG